MYGKKVKLRILFLFLLLASLILIVYLTAKIKMITQKNIKNHINYYLRNINM